MSSFYPDFYGIKTSEKKRKKNFRTVFDQIPFQLCVCVVSKVLFVCLQLTTTGQDEESHNIATGDNVEVVEGELVNLMGRVTRVDGTRVSVQPTHDELKDELEFFAHELKKFFRQGDHVKVIAGRFEGDTGLIVRVEENLIVLFSDLTMHELKVSTSLSVVPRLCLSMVYHDMM